MSLTPKETTGRRAGPADDEDEDEENGLRALAVRTPPRGRRVPASAHTLQRQAAIAATGPWSSPDAGGTT